MRLFIGVGLAPRVVGELRRTLAALESRVPRGRWVRPEDAHLTLAFLGETAPARLEEVKRALRDSVHGTGAFELAFGGTGAFASWVSARVLWLGVDRGGEVLERMEANLRPRLAALGFRAEDRPYRPHLTLCRFSTPRNLGPVREMIERLGDPAAWSACAMEVSSVDLIRSELTPQGPVYTVLSREPLSPKAVPRS